MARAQVATVCLMMMLAVAMLATTASAQTDHMKASASPGRKLQSTPQAIAAVEAGLASRRKLAATDAAQQRETCQRINGDDYCGRGTQFNCCTGWSNKLWKGCVVHDNNYLCPSNRANAVCCWTK